MQGSMWDEMLRKSGKQATQQEGQVIQQMQLMDAANRLKQMTGSQPTQQEMEMIKRFGGVMRPARRLGPEPATQQEQEMINRFGTLQPQQEQSGKEITGAEIQELLRILGGGK